MIDIKRFMSRLRHGAIKKSLVAGLVTSLFILTVFSAIGWYCGLKEMWLTILIFFSAFIVGSILFYYIKYRPTEKQVATTIDELGLEERVITMEQLKNDDSFMAKKQRQDTLNVLSKVNEKRLPLLLSTALLICMAIAIPLGTGFTTVHALSTKGILPFGQEALQKIPPKHTVEYDCTEGGKIVGKSRQYITENEEASAIIAIANEGYIFLKWNDGYKNNYRKDVAADNIKVKAIFVALDDWEADESIIDPEGKKGSDNSKQTPGSEKSNDDAPPSDGNREGQDGPPNQGPVGSGAPDESHKIIDGKTDYGGKILNDAQQNAIERANSDTNLTNKDKQLIDSYYDAISR